MDDLSLGLQTILAQLGITSPQELALLQRDQFACTPGIGAKRLDESDLWLADNRLVWGAGVRKMRAMLGGKDSDRLERVVVTALVGAIEAQGLDLVPACKLLDQMITRARKQSETTSLRDAQMSESSIDWDNMTQEEYLQESLRLSHVDASQLSGIARVKSLDRARKIRAELDSIQSARRELTPDAAGELVEEIVNLLSVPAPQVKTL